MNKHDSERIGGMLETFGSMPVDSVEESDIIVFMTCCVREAADVRLMGQVASYKNIPLRKDSPLTKRIVAIGGCIGQRDGQKLVDELSHVDVVFGTHNLGSMPNLILAAIQEETSQVEVVEDSDEDPGDLPIRRDNSWSAWLPITMGCNNFCSYCIVPYVRGREKSRPFDEIAREAQALVNTGVREITLLGQNVNSYGRDLFGDARFAELLCAVADTGIDRLRFATSHPKDLNDRVIKLFGELDNLMPALHLPVQSGSNRIIRAMNRRYTREHYLELVDKVRTANPNVLLSTDIIVGFPGETEEDFEQTYSLVDEVGYGQVFTFIYSKREGTPAAKIVDNTPHEVIQERFDRLVDLVQNHALVENKCDEGSVVDVLVEGTSKRDDRVIAGKSPRNQTVHAAIPEGLNIEDLKGKIVPVSITRSRAWYLQGDIVGAAR